MQASPHLFAGARQVLFALHRLVCAKIAHNVRNNATLLIVVHLKSLDNKFIHNTGCDPGSDYLNARERWQILSKLSLFQKGN